MRRASLEDASRQLAKLDALKDQITFHAAALENELSLYKLIAKVQPDECYHMAASSFVSYSFEEESSILTTNFSGTHFLLASLKEAVPHCRFFWLLSSFRSPVVIFRVVRLSQASESLPPQGLHWPEEEAVLPEWPKR